MRRLAAGLVVGIALVGGVYLGSLELGGPAVRCGVVPSVGLGFGGKPNPCRSGGPILFAHSQAGWQIPVSILIGVVGVAGGLVVLRTRPKRPLGNATRAA